MSVKSIRKKIKRTYKNTVEDIKYTILSSLFRAVRVKKNRIVFNNFKGKDFGDNPKYIAEEIIKQKLPYELYWVTKKKATHLPKEIKSVKVGSLKEAYIYATSSVIICNTKQRLPFKKKKEQYYIQTWHGSFPLKFIEKEAEDMLSSRYIQHSIEDSKITDLILSGSGVLSNVIKKSFWYQGEILECGAPRDDIYFNHTQEDIKNIKKKLQIPLKKKVAIYAPTFRDNRQINVYNLNFQDILQALQKKTGDEWVFIIRLHPNISRRDHIFTYSENIINGSTYSDQQELFLLSDLLITDYSSIMMDFGIMQKPVFLYIPDLEEYKKSRGIRPIFDQLPFPYAYNNKELIQAILSLNEKDYQNKLSCFIQEYYKNFSNGDASQQVVKRIKKVIKNLG